MKWETYRQDVFDSSPPPSDDGWEPFAATANTSSDRFGTTVCSEIIWWKRPIVDQPEENTTVKVVEAA